VAVCRLKHELSSLVRELRSWVRIPLKTRISVCLFCVCVLSCAQVAALRRGESPSKEFYRLCEKDQETEKGDQGPTKGCRAINRRRWDKRKE
jgi:hypothetical protein